MATRRMDRRSVLMSAGAWTMAAAVLQASGGIAARAAAGGSAQGGEVFAADTVRRLAERLSQKEFQKPRIDLPEPYNKLTYDQYRDIRFRQDKSIWRGQGLDYELQLFPIGFLYDMPVELWLVEDGKSTKLRADGSLFQLGPQLAKPGDKVDEAAPYGFSGFRVHGPINRSDYFDEFAVFQGASYFRAVARGQVYGMSSRGLAINTARPGGEEFPFFRAFWIEKPKPGAPEIIVHALLDSPSTAGAYRFSIQPGASTIVDVDITLFPRKALSHVGIAPLTSMFLHGNASRRLFGDVRPAVHDSEGLAILNGKGERLWRPLTNPRKLQTSAFVDNNPKGFGLVQRDRNFHHFEDLEAHFERRPTVWVEPKGTWGVGVVELIEIPAEEEIHDNIVAYWKPAVELAPGQAHTLSYRMHWTDSVPVAAPGARVNKTFVGNSRKPGTLLFVVDFDGPATKEIRDLPVAHVSTSAGTLSNIVMQQNGEISGLRVSFELNPNGTDLAELRLVLKANDQQISEIWLYRWTKS